MNNKTFSLLIIFILGLLYFLLGKFAFLFAISYETVTSAIFLSEGVALAFILLYGRKVWPGIFIGQMLLGISTSLPISITIIISAGNSIEAVAAFWVLNKLKFNKNLNSLRDYLLLVFIIFFLLQPLSAGIGISSLFFLKNLKTEDLIPGFTYWWIGNSMGQMLLTPLILGAAAVLKNRPTLLKEKLREGILSALIVGIISSLIFILWGESNVLRNVNAFFLMLPIVIFLSLKFDYTGAVVSSFVISLIAQIFTVSGVGPFSGGEVQSNLISLNIFIISITLSAGFTGILFLERKRNEIKLQSALDEIKTLQGILPICSNCKKVRNDEGYWERIETYIENHSEAEFSHSICDQCAEELYGKEKWFKKNE